MSFCRAKVQTLKNENEFDLKFKSERNKSYTGNVEHFKDFASTGGASKTSNPSIVNGKWFVSDVLLLNLLPML